MNIKRTLSIFLVWGLISAPAYAEDKEQKEQIEVMHQSILNLVKQLTRKGVLTREAADKLMREAEESAAKSVAEQEALAASAAAAASSVAATYELPAVEPVAPGVVRVPYIPETVKNEITEQIKHEVLAQARGERWGDPGSLPGWLKRISFNGDFRLRYQRDSFPAGNATPAEYNPAGLTLISNTTDTHNYLRVQARLGMKAKLSDQTYTAFRFSSGTTTNQVSTNQTLGTGFNKSSLVLDRAFIHSDPYPWLAFDGGKIPNPWLSTDLVWDSDVNFEGLATQFNPRFSDSWRSFLTLGAFPYQNIERSDSVLAHSKWLYGSQLGLVWAAPDSSNAQLGVALYRFSRVEGTVNDTLGSQYYDKTAAQGMQKGNHLMYVNAVGDPVLYGIASKFKELSITAKMDSAAFDPIHVVLTGDYVKNLGYDQTEIANRTGLAAPPPKVKGHAVSLMVGVPKIVRSGEWQARIAYKYLEADAVLDALTDSDFHLGGTNAKGFIVGGSYGVDDNTWLNLRWYSTDQIDGVPLAIDTLQLDLNARF
ncbi:MAG: putative porin [Gammaproteobacteria bacterium]|nr:putative porin [Gammaproteobacteria bacterium]MBU1482922.1 putative porin [Gammaproteobacteria bacterium]